MKMPPMRCNHVRNCSELDERILSTNMPSVENINEFLQVIIQAKNLAGDYSENKMTYSIHGQILLDFIKYPSNLWKINEI